MENYKVSTLWYEFSILSTVEKTRKIHKKMRKNSVGRQNFKDFQVNYFEKHKNSSIFTFTYIKFQSGYY